MKKILLVNGPNLSVLGKREPEIYGDITLDEIEKSLIEEGRKRGVEVKPFQSEVEGEIVGFILKEGFDADGVIINAGAYTHTSIAIRDALVAVGADVVEVHISNVFKRERFRRRSFLSDIAVGVITGLGVKGYLYALDSLLSGERDRLRCGIGESRFPRVRVQGVVVRDGRILLVKHRKYGKEYWVLPGGGLEYRETIFESLKREFEEELGVSAEPVEVLKLRDFIPEDEDRHIVDVYVKCEISGSPRITGEDPLVVDFGWFDASELENLICYPDEGFLKRFIS